MLDCFAWKWAHHAASSQFALPFGALETGGCYLRELAVPWGQANAMSPATPHKMQDGFKLAGWIQICRIPTAGSTVA